MKSSVHVLKHVVQSARHAALEYHTLIMDSTYNQWPFQEPKLGVPTIKPL